MEIHTHTHTHLRRDKTHTNTNTTKTGAKTQEKQLKKSPQGLLQPEMSFALSESE